MWLRDMRGLIANASAEELRELVHAVYQRIVVEGSRFAEVTLTPAAYAHGLALALPENVIWRPRQDSDTHLRPT